MSVLGKENIRRRRLGARLGWGRGAAHAAWEYRSKQSGERQAKDGIRRGISKLWRTCHDIRLRDLGKIS